MLLLGQSSPDHVYSRISGIPVTNGPLYTGRFIMFSVIANVHNKKTKGPTLMELFTATGKMKKFFFFFDN